MAKNHGFFFLDGNPAVQCCGVVCFLLLLFLFSLLESWAMHYTCIGTLYPDHTPLHTHITHITTGCHGFTASLQRWGKGGGDGKR
ncbi:hypothetical protein QBC41DRAFT_309668 [Cercophora samala]|uniref:Uncharacterized protein n=1 Tax=Cercophora samala TaxID=330535 RepID=A0AA39ZN42_9PEZI|nr:hypothetical protein QBC41DRAFT_309668 [Cercophora samala]